VLDENPLSEMVELPADALEGGLWFSQVLCGVVRGALEMVSAVLVLERLDRERGREGRERREENQTRDRPLRAHFTGLFSLACGAGPTSSGGLLRLGCTERG